MLKITIYELLERELIAAYLSKESFVDIDREFSFFFERFLDFLRRLSLKEGWEDGYKHFWESPMNENIDENVEKGDLKHDVLQAWG